jgi:hypothetical protein
MMNQLKPKEQHERFLANADKEKIAEHLDQGRDQEVTRIAVTLARQCDLYVHFQRLWLMRVSELDADLGSEGYTRNIYVNRTALHKEFIRTASQP